MLAAKDPLNKVIDQFFIIDLLSVFVLNTPKRKT